MVTRAFIIIPRRPASLIHSESISPLSYVGGLPIITRILYSAQWAGISEGIILSYGGWDEIKRLVLTDPNNRAFVWLDSPVYPGQTESPEARLAAAITSRPFVLLSSHWLLDRKKIQDLCSRQLDPGTKLVVESDVPSSADTLPPAALVDGSVHRDIVEAMLRGEDIATISMLLRTGDPSRTEILGAPDLVRVQYEDDRAEADAQLYKGLIKPTESFMSRFVERKISLAVTRRLIYSSITPNQISVFSIVLGILSGLLFIPHPRISHVAGSLVLLFSSIIDGCDGEIARLKFLESKSGSWIDFLGDNLVHTVVFFCIGMGLYGQGYGSLYLVLGIIGALGTVGSASMVFYRVFLRQKGRVITFATPVRVEEMERAGGRLRTRIEFADKISNRDFVWLILGCSIAGLLWLWAWFCAVGVLFYFFHLLYIYLKMRSLPSASH